jgi:hypothetical protein
MGLCRSQGSRSQQTNAHGTRLAKELPSMESSQVFSQIIWNDSWKAARSASNSAGWAPQLGTSRIDLGQQIVGTDAEIA